MFWEILVNTIFGRIPCLLENVTCFAQEPLGGSCIEYELTGRITHASGVVKEDLDQQ